MEHTIEERDRLETTREAERERAERFDAPTAKQIKSELSDRLELCYRTLLDCRKYVRANEPGHALLDTIEHTFRRLGRSLEAERK